MTHPIPAGHDCAAAFAWWEGSRSRITNEPHEVALLLSSMARDASPAATYAAAHIAPILKDGTDIVPVMRRIDAWLTPNDRASFDRQTALKSELRGLIACGGFDRELDADLHEAIDDMKLVVAIDGYSITLMIEERDGRRVLCIAGRSMSDPDDLDTLAEIGLGEAPDDRRDEAEPTTPMPAPQFA